MNNIQTKLLYAYTSKHLFAIMQDDAHFITQEIEQLLSSLQNCDKQVCVDPLCLGHNKMLASSESPGVQCIHHIELNRLYNVLCGNKTAQTDRQTDGRTPNSSDVNEASWTRGQGRGQKEWGRGRGPKFFLRPRPDTLENNSVYMSMKTKILAFRT